jgi:uroporphyrinogen decarboxylase
VSESIDYLSAQADAGAQAVQIFDSWAGDLIGTELEEFVMKPLAAIVAGVRARHPSLPVIVFARGVGMAQRRVAVIPGASAIGVETEFELADLPKDVVVQGNLDPVSLLAGVDVVASEVKRICGSVDRQRHIFNLGHGIRLGTDPSVVGAVVEAVRRCDG